MSEKSTFFNSVSGDRKYKAEDMALHFSKVLTNGVMPLETQLQATADSGMNIVVSAGSAWINGYAYHNDSNFTLTIDAADGVLNRIDRIVVRWGRLARSINLAIVKGTPGSSPTAPAVVRSADYWDLGIATVLIGAGITAITQSMITDTRTDATVCGKVSSLITPSDAAAQAQHTTQIITLDVDSWEDSEQTAEVAGVTDTNTVFVAPAPGSQEAYGESGILCTAQGAGELTFTCTATPEADITVNVVMMGVLS